jgi:hypothetical protein
MQDLTLCGGSVGTCDSLKGHQATDSVYTNTWISSVTQLRLSLMYIDKDKVFRSNSLQ